MAVRLLTIGGEEVGKTRPHVARNVLYKDRDGIRLGVERDEKVLVFQLCKSAFDQALVSAQLPADFVEVMRGDGVHTAYDNAAHLLIRPYGTAMNIFLGQFTQPPLKRAPKPSQIFLAPPTRTGRFNPNAFPLLQSDIEFPGQIATRAICTDDGGFAWRTVIPTLQSPRAARASVRQQRHLYVGKNFDFAHHPVSPAMPASASTSSPQPVLAHSQGVRILQRLGRCVQGIRHVGVHAGNAVFRWPRSHSP